MAFFLKSDEKFEFDFGRKFDKARRAVYYCCGIKMTHREDASSIVE
jgi:hypothetical protein